jgi:hypothetical protein
VHGQRIYRCLFDSSAYQCFRTLKWDLQPGTGRGARGCRDKLPVVSSAKRKSSISLEDAGSENIIKGAPYEQLNCWSI